MENSTRRYMPAGGGRSHGQAGHSEGANATFFDHQSCSNCNRGSFELMGRSARISAIAHRDSARPSDATAAPSRAGRGGIPDILRRLFARFTMRICGCASPRPISGKPLTIWTPPSTTKGNWPSLSMSRRRWSHASRIGRPSVMKSSRRTGRASPPFRSGLNQRTAISMRRAH